MLVIDELRTDRYQGLEEMSARVRVDDLESRLWFRWNGVACPVPGDALLLAAVQPAMRRGSDVQISQPVSEELLDTLFEIQQHLKQFDPNLDLIEVRADKVHKAAEQELNPVLEEQSATGVLFDGGVDAFYTYHENNAEIQAIVYISDFIDDTEVPQNKGTAIKSAKHRTRDLDKPLVHVQTNLKHFLKAFGNDPEIDLALVIAVIDTVLCGQLGKLVIPGTTSSAEASSIQAKIAASLPETEFAPLFDTYLPGGRIQFDYQSATVELSDKMESLQTDHTILEALRVCWENPDRSYNCGRCIKCTRRVSAKRLMELLRRDSRALQRNNTNAQ